MRYYCSFEIPDDSIILCPGAKVRISHRDGPTETVLVKIMNEDEYETYCQCKLLADNCSPMIQPCDEHY